MRVWLYGRLSDDDDVEMHSLKNQMQIIRDYAREQGYTVVGESFDDNFSDFTDDINNVHRILFYITSIDYIRIIGILNCPSVRFFSFYFFYNRISHLSCSSI